MTPSTPIRDGFSTPPPVWSDHGLLAAGSLALVVLGLVQARHGAWSLLPAVIGGVALVLRWRSAPLMILPAIVLVVVARSQGLDPYQLLVRLFAMGVGYFFGVPFFSPFRPLVYLRNPPLVAEVMLAAGLLGYFIAAYHLAALRFGPFPPEPRRRSLPRPRPTAPVLVLPAPGRRQLVAAAAVPLAVALLGVLGWRWIDRREPPLDLMPTPGRLVLIVAVFGIPVLAVSVLLRSLALWQLSREQAALYLQDVAWQETRREQRRMQRWRVWARLRRRWRGTTP